MMFSGCTWFWQFPATVRRTDNGWECEVEISFHNLGDGARYTESVRYVSRWWIAAWYFGRLRAVKLCNKLLAIYDGSPEPQVDLPFEDETDGVVLTRE